MAFNRFCELYVGKLPYGNKFEDGSAEIEEGYGYLIRDLHFDFDVFRTVDFYKNRACFKIYNANATTIEKVMTEGNAVVFRAGYADGKVGTIYIGQIDECYTDRMNNGDTVTTIICVTQRGAQYPLGRVIATLSFPSGSTYYDVLKYIADFAGVPLSGASTLKDFTLDGRYYDVGSIVELVKNFRDEFLLAEGGDVIIDNNEMIYIQKTNVNFVEGENVDERGRTVIDTIALTLRSGLLHARKVRKERTSVEEKFKKNIDYYMGLTEVEKTETPKERKQRLKKEKNEPAKPLAQVDFSCLINPALSPNIPVYIDNRRIVDGAIDVNDKLGFYGTYMLTEVRFIGNNYGGQYQANCKGEIRGT